MSTTTESAAAELSKFLTDRNTYSRRSPLDDMLQARITEMAREIAGEVVEATPGLAEVIRRDTRLLVDKALKEDGYLSRIVVSAVAEALHKHALGDAET